MTTVVCVWVQANVPYGPEYVACLHAMVARQLHRSHRFVCLTDRPTAVPAGIEAIRIPSPLPLFGWWSKVRLFDKSLPFETRVLYLDLDTLIVGRLEPVLDFPSPFALVPHEGNFRPRTHEVVPRFNSSVMVWDAGANWPLFDEWTPRVAKHYWGDQDWIAASAPDADTMPAAWFPRLSTIQAGPVPMGARVVLAKKPKPSEAARKWSWVHDVWRAA